MDESHASEKSLLGQYPSMLRSIRNQILVPIVAIQAVAVMTVVLTAATLAARRMETQIVDRLNGVIETLGHANFPYTSGVLAKMKGLSGAEFAAFTDDRRVTESTLSGLKLLPTEVAIGGQSQQINTLATSPTVVIDETSYFATTFTTASGSGGTQLLVLYSETAWRQARIEAATMPLIVGLAALFSMVAVTGLIAHQIGRRIREVQRQVARIAAGDFEEFAPSPVPDEIQALSKSVNLMCSQLRRMSETIHQSERSRLLAQLGAGLAHQLRNSLTGAKISIQLHARRHPPPQGDETLNVAIRQLAMTEEQVKGLLSLGRVEERPPERCDARAILADVASLILPTCSHAKVKLIQDCIGSSLHFMADRTGIRAAVLNLALNALEAAGPGGEVNVRAVESGGDVEIAVVDTGPGPAAGLNDAVFEPFVTTKPEGVGLGLALARHVAITSGGRLEWSRRDGKTTFRLIFPALANTSSSGNA